MVEVIQNPAWWMVGFAAVGLVSGALSTYITIRVVLTLMRNDIDHLREALKDAVSALRTGIESGKHNDRELFGRMANVESRVSRIEGHLNIQKGDG